MKCAKLNLQERLKPRPRAGRHGTSTDRVQRYCQKRMVDPSHDEDPRWNVMERFYCNKDDDDIEPGTSDIYHFNREHSDELFLSVQTLKFQGDVEERKRPRNNFKYKSITNANRHRMFIKQTVEEIDKLDDDFSSQQTSCYFDDYVKFIINDRSRPSTGKSSVYGNNTENKAIQVEPQGIKNQKPKPKAKSKAVRLDTQRMDPLVTAKDSGMGDTKITYHKSGKRKSLTISKTQSPETVQVIRVDVVCNYNCSSADSIITENEENASNKPEESIADRKAITPINLKNNPYANKYLLTKSIKSLDENISGGKVTLLCKTFKLSDRSIHRIDSRKSVNSLNKLYRNGQFY